MATEKKILDLVEDTELEDADALVVQGESGLTGSTKYALLSTLWTWAREKADSLYSAIGHSHSGVYDPAGTATGAVAAHVAALDPHPTYLTESDGDIRYSQTTHNHSGTYQPIDADLTAIAALSATGGYAKRTASDTWSIATPTASDVGADASGTASSAVSAHNLAFTHSDIALNTSARHSHSNQSTLDSIAVPVPSGKYLRDDGSWQTVSGGSATQAFGTISVSGQNDVVADAAPDTLILVAGTNIQITTTEGSDTVAIAAAHSHTAADVGADATGTAAAAVSAHAALPDPHPGYLTQDEGDARYSQTTHNHSGTYQPIDADLTAIAALSTTGYAKRTAADTWSLATPTASEVGALDQTTGDGRYSQLGHTHSYQPIDADLTAIAALSGTGGYAKRTGADTWSIATPSYSDVGAEPANSNIQSHISSTSNPHSVTAAQAGAIPAPGSPQTGDILWYSGSAWTRLPHSVTASPSSGAVSVDLSTTAKTVSMTLESGQATTTITVSGGISGQVYLFRIIQGSTGNNGIAFSPTLGYGSDILALPTLSTAAGKVDILAVLCVTAGSVYRLIAFARGY